MPVTLQTLAENCGLSTATVSRALAGHRYVNADVRARVQHEAERLGYRRNHLVGALMSHVRRTQAQRFIGNLAIVHVPSPNAMEVGAQERRIIDSAIARARELGFSAELFELGTDRRGETAFARVCRARGVTGVIFVYPGPSEAPHFFPWEDFSAVAIDFARGEPLLDTVCHDHFVTFKAALRELHKADYRRFGLFIERFKDERTDGRWSGSFLSFQSRPSGIGRVPVLSPEKIDEASFLDWYERHTPDLVIGHLDRAVGWLRRAGVRVPQTTAFFSLNWLDRSLPCAGIDPQLELQGRVAAESLISQVHRGERGLPVHPRLITVRGRFVPGPTAPGAGLP